MCASAAPSCTTPLKRTSNVIRGPGEGEQGWGTPEGGGAGGRICRTELHNATKAHLERGSWGGRGVGVGDPGGGGQVGASAAPSCTTPLKCTSYVGRGLRGGGGEGIGC